MRAFTIHVNGKRLCVAGVGDEGVLSAMASCVTRPGKKAELLLDVGGLLGSTSEHLRWAHRPLRVGDEVMLKVVDANSFDRPTKKYRTDPAKALASKKHYVLETAKQLGWTVRRRPKKSKS